MFLLKSARPYEKIDRFIVAAVIETAGGQIVT